MKPAPLQLRTAYGVCRHITRTAARNFYYAFLVLPKRKRDALSAVYAFMRHADDVSDDPQLPPEEKRAKLDAWRQAMHEVIAGSQTDDPVLMALADSQRRFKIPPELLEKLVYGTSMDVAPQTAEPEPAGPKPPVAFYRTFDELYRYCYHVASVVGLVCIRVFGYRDPKAESLAEKCGVAFQLTNIIRDVKEDAGLGRVYLPIEDMQTFALSPVMLQEGGNAAAFRPVLVMQAERAREFYRAGEELIPLVDHDSRPALWTLVEIYRRLLDKMAARNFDVFSERVRLSAREKTALLARGMWRRLWE